MSPGSADAPDVRPGSAGRECAVGRGSTRNDQRLGFDESRLRQRNSAEVFEGDEQQVITKKERPQMRILPIVSLFYLPVMYNIIRNTNQSATWKTNFGRTRKARGITGV